MFTSEHLSRLRQTTAPRIRTLVAALAICAASFAVSVTFLGWWTQGDISHRALAVRALGPDTRALILGSSHVFASINPALMRSASMNLAAPVCSYVCAEGILLGNLAKVPSLQALVIELDVVPSFYDTLRAYQGDYRQLLELEPDIWAMQIGARDKYTLWRDDALERSFLGPLFRFGKLTPQEVMSHARGRVPEDAVVSAGYANGHEVMPPTDDGPARVRRHVREAVGVAELPRNEAALRRIIELGLSRDLKLALVRLPHHPSYWAALPDAWQRSMSGLLARLQRDFGGKLEYWDYGDLPGLSDTDYRNGDHMNAGAAGRFTQRLDELLLDWMSAERGGG
jgi:hypothetical protein